MGKRLPKAQRREQLLKTALEIVKQEGADALTLASLAERAGVSKPVAYDHFETREGLLDALHRDYEDRQTDAMRKALALNGRTLADAARIVSAAYVDCVLSAGPESEAVAAALSAYPGWEDLAQRARDFHVEEYGKVFAPFVDLPSGRAEALLLAIVGSAEALSSASATGHLTGDEAIGALSEIICSVLGRYTR